MSWHNLEKPYHRWTYSRYHGHTVFLFKVSEVIYAPSHPEWGGGVKNDGRLSYLLSTSVTVVKALKGLSHQIFRVHFWIVGKA